MEVNNIENVIFKNKEHFLSTLARNSKYEACSLNDLDLDKIVLPAGVIFRNTIFTGASLRHVESEGINYNDCNFANADMQYINLSESVFQNCSLEKTDFKGAKLNCIRADNCNISNARFNEANLFGSVFKECKLVGAAFIGAKTDGWSIQCCNMRYAWLRGLSFRKQIMRQNDFQEAELSECDFTDTIFEGGSIAQAKIHMTRFKGADLRTCNIGENIRIETNVLSGATLSAAQGAQLLAEYGINII